MKQCAKIVFLALVACSGPIADDPDASVVDAQPAPFVPPWDRAYSLSWSCQALCSSESPLRVYSQLQLNRDLGRAVLLETATGAEEAGAMTVDPTGQCATVEGLRDDARLVMCLAVRNLYGWHDMESAAGVSRWAFEGIPASR